MKLKIYITLLLLLAISSSYSQVGIGTASPNVTSMLDITSTNSGLLIPRIPLLSASDITTIPLPVTSLLVYNSGFAPNGYYYFNGTIWVQLAVGTNTDWSLTGNTGTNPGTNFLGTIDDKDIVIKRFNARAGYIGDPTYNLTTFDSNNGNTSFGGNSLVNPTVNVGSQTGVRNSAFGVNVMPGLTTGQRNSGVGDFALFSTTSGNENTAVGVGALYSNTISSGQTAFGRNALTSFNGPNTANIGNTAVGFNALRNTVTGIYNTAIGYEALRNTTGSGNVGVGFQAGRLEAGSNKLYIENSNADANNALIYGEFDNDIVKVNGALGISITPSAGSKLDVNGKTKTTNFQMTNGANVNYVLQSDAAGNASWVAPTVLTITETDPQVSSATSNVVPKWNGTTLVDGVMVDDGTNVGVGMTPTTGNKLEVNGKTKTTDFQMTTGAAVNYILQSDASGNASWALPNNTISIIRATMSGGTDQTLTNTGWQKVTFNNTVFDTNSEFNTSLNRFVATNAGYYQINAGYHIKSTGSTNQFGIGVRINNNFYQETSGFHFGSGIVARNINCIVNLAVGDYVEIFVENTASGLFIDGYSGKTFFEVKQIK